MVKFTKEDAKRLSALGEEGLLREMILSESDWKTKNEWAQHLMEKGIGMSGGKLAERMESLKQKGLVEETTRRKRISRYEEVKVYRPDASEEGLDVFKLINVRKDFRTFLYEVRHRFRLTCLRCGYSENKLLHQALRLRCPKCRSFNIRIEYLRLFDPRENSEDTASEADEHPHYDIAIECGNKKVYG
jgi:hypothetical protein